MWIVVSQSVFDYLKSLNGVEDSWFNEADLSVNMSEICDLGYYEEGDDGFYSVNLKPSEEGAFIPNSN